ncbi:hypothetical protein MPLDJ20_100078 [Mesorhizobium plurifarium]|uniref:Uncharacterized protein n=1 Tax=Mesorhizobium plurifarium TaxID=69974 RepID=A0A090F5A4_MESPL|nr:hypothetical protein MPLDJ20_100078 [Mesorhizobium plurifarium]CDX38888.1 hypothetical protein MPLSOD_340081 [Mesorhizobium sp. SOD10]
MFRTRNGVVAAHRGLAKNAFFLFRWSEIGQPTQEECVPIDAEHSFEEPIYEAIVSYGETSLRALCHLLANCAAGIRTKQCRRRPPQPT